MPASLLLLAAVAPGGDWPALLTALVVCATLVALLIGQRGPDMAMIGGVVVLLAAGILTPEEALKGMANEGMITVAALFVVAAAVERTGALATVVDRVLGRPATLASAQLRTMIGPAFVSAFMNNTPVVALMVPAIRDWAKKHRFSVSKLLMPMNAAVVLGGLCTLIGTSTNIVVSGLVKGKTGAPLGMFEITPLGVPLLLAGMVYLVFASRTLLRDRRPAMSVGDDPREYTLEMVVEEGSPLAGRTIEEAGLRGLDGLFLMEIDRGGHFLAPVAPTERLEDGDRLVFVGIVESVVELQKLRGLRPATDQLFTLDGPRSERTLIEAVVSNSCPLVGRSIRDARFRSSYDAVVIAVGRNGERLRMKTGDIVLQPGDTLLLEAAPGFVSRQRSNRDFYLVSEVSDSRPPRHDRAALALIVLVTMVAAATLELVPMVAAAPGRKAVLSTASSGVANGLAPGRCRVPVMYSLWWRIRPAPACSRAFSRVSAMCQLSRTRQFLRSTVWPCFLAAASAKPHWVGRDCSPSLDIEPMEMIPMPCLPASVMPDGLI